MMGSPPTLAKCATEEMQVAFEAVDMGKKGYLNVDALRDALDPKLRN